MILSYVGCKPLWGLLLVAGLCQGQAKFEISPSQIQGIDLIGAAVPEFSVRVAQLVPEGKGMTALQPVLPYSVLVRNSGSRAVSMYVVKWDYRRPDGSPVWAVSKRGIPNSSPWLPPAALHFVAPLGGVTQAVANRTTDALPDSPAYAQGLEQLIDAMRRSPAVVVSLDAVVFEDGQFQGPDALGTYARLSGVLEEGARMHHDLQQMVADAAPDEKILARLDEVIARQSPDFVEHMLGFHRIEAIGLRGILVRMGRARFEQSLQLHVRIFSARTPALWR